jgi:hypothetical protein
MRSDNSKKGPPSPKEGERFFKKYNPEFCDLLIEHMSGGYSFHSFCAIAGCARSTLYEWVDNIPDFAAAKAIGHAKGLLFVEKHLFTKMTGHAQGDGMVPRDIDPGSIYFTLRTRFHDTYYEPKETPKEAEDNSVSITYELKKPE